MFYIYIFLHIEIIKNKKRMQEIKKEGSHKYHNDFTKKF